MEDPGDALKGGDLCPPPLRALGNALYCVKNSVPDLPLLLREFIRESEEDEKHSGELRIRVESLKKSIAAITQNLSIITADMTPCNTRKCSVLAPACCPDLSW
mmetsp:Transcript_43575/g.102416  ORF Transcript_43575/g.102416 Transcript_43575/m.102416 type:complete len:103 (-) Transcript_43575:39-347(-)|eukprot:1733135-Rhodomonas_salina.1